MKENLKKSRNLTKNQRPPKPVLTEPEGPRISFYPYQEEAFHNKTNGIEVWLWGRQTGKSFTLAAWAVDRIIANPGRLVTILSNSRANGMELNLKCAQICRDFQAIYEQEDLSPDTRFETMNYETRITIDGKVGRIKVLAANPLTARGFSGDLILDEFAFHQDSHAIWNAAEPILQAHPDYLCRIASTPNGRYNSFYRLCSEPGIPLRKIPRSEAWKQGLKIFHPITRKEISPDEARALALDKRDYDQNYECVFENENSALLTSDLISAAERHDCGYICEGDWSEEALAYLAAHGHREPEFGKPSPIIGNLVAGVDVGRNHDMTVISVLEKCGSTLLLRAMLRLRNMRLPDQQERIAKICENKGLYRLNIDMTGIGLGLYEYLRQKHSGKIVGINFASTVTVPGQSKHENVRVTELMATQLLRAFEDRAIQVPVDLQLREDLRKPERQFNPSGSISIAATRDSAGHADHFWSLALAVYAAKDAPAARVPRGPILTSEQIAWEIEHDRAWSPRRSWISF